MNINKLSAVTILVFIFLFGRPFHETPAKTLENKSNQALAEWTIMATFQSQ